MKSYPAIGIRPIVDSRRLGIRDALEGKVREMAEAAKALIEQNVFYADGTPAKVVIFSGSIAGERRLPGVSRSLRHSMSPRR